MHEIAHCHATEVKNASLGDEPKRQRFNVELKEENALQYACMGAITTLDRQAIEIEALQGLHVKRILEMINLQLRQNRFSHPLQGVQQSGTRETGFLGKPQPLPSSVEWNVVLTDLGKHEASPGCMTCVGDCKPECYGIKTVDGSTEAMKTVFTAMTMYPLDEASLENWHPAIIGMGPHSTFAILSFLGNNASFEKLRTSYEVMFVAREKWSNSLTIQHQSEEMETLLQEMDCEAYKEDLIADKKFPHKRVLPVILEVTIRLAVVDVYGRTVVDEVFNPPSTVEPHVFPMQNIRVLREYQEELGHLARKEQKVGMPKQLIEAVFYEETSAHRPFENVNDPRALTSSVKLMNVMKLINPMLLGTRSTTHKLLQNSGHARQYSCTTIALMQPEKQTILVCWDSEDIVSNGMPAQNGNVIPFVLSSALPLVFLMHFPDKEPTLELLKQNTFCSVSLETAYKTLFMRVPCQLHMLQGKIMCAKLFMVKMQFWRRHKDVFDLAHYDVSEIAWHRLPKVHRDPVLSDVRPWADVEYPYHNLTSEVYKNVLYRLFKYQIPQALHMTFCIDEGFMGIPGHALQRKEAERCKIERAKVAAIVEQKKAEYKMELLKSEIDLATDIITPDLVKNLEEYVYGKNEFPKMSLIVVQRKGDATPTPKSHHDVEDVVLSSDTESEPEDEGTAQRVKIQTVNQTVMMTRAKMVKVSIDVEYTGC